MRTYYAHYPDTTAESLRAQRVVQAQRSVKVKLSKTQRKLVAGLAARQSMTMEEIAVEILGIDAEDGYVMALIRKHVSLLRKKVGAERVRTIWNEEHFGTPPTVAGYAWVEVLA